MKTLFYSCDLCGNVVMKIHDSGMKPYCCGKAMNELRPEYSESEIGERHVPECTLKGNKLNVKIGAKEHPATEEHHIEWIYVQTNKGGFIRYIGLGEKPEISLKLCCDGEKIETVYCFCNLHGLWALDCSMIKVEENDACGEDCQKMAITMHAEKFLKQKGILQREDDDLDECCKITNRQKVVNIQQLLYGRCLCTKLKL